MPVHEVLQLLACSSPLLARPGQLVPLPVGAPSEHSWLVSAELFFDPFPHRCLDLGHGFIVLLQDRADAFDDVVIGRVQGSISSEGRGGESGMARECSTTGGGDATGVAMARIDLLEPIARRHATDYSSEELHEVDETGNVVPPPSRASNAYGEYPTNKPR